MNEEIVSRLTSFIGKSPTAFSLILKVGESLWDAAILKQ